MATWIFLLVFLLTCFGRWAFKPVWRVVSGCCWRSPCSSSMATSCIDISPGLQVPALLARALPISSLLLVELALLRPIWSREEAAVSGPCAARLRNRELASRGPSRPQKGFSVQGYVRSRVGKKG